MAILDVNELSKVFGDTPAVKEISFQVTEGEVFGLLGPNGAGKSTTISMLSGLLPMTSGDIHIGGHSVRHDPQRVKEVIGVVPQDIALYPTLTARENLTFWGRMYGLSGKAVKSRTEEVLEIVGLTDRGNQRVDQYSGGMKRRVNIAAGLLHRPKVLVMDEPTVGIDPQSRNHILETVKELNGQGLTVIYTSHYMEEVEFLCDRVGIIDHGEFIAMGTKAELRTQAGQQDVVRIKATPIDDGIISALKTLPGINKVTTDEQGIEAWVSNGRELLGSMVAMLGQYGAKVTGIDVREPDLESLFLNLTGRALRDQ